MSLTSIAKTFKVYYKSGLSFHKLDDAVVDNITINDFNSPSTVAFTMLTARAGDEQLIGHGSLIKVTSGQATIFMGMITNHPQGAAGTSGGGSPYERVGFKAMDYRYILSRTNVICGVYGHGYSDYDFTSFDPADTSKILTAQDTCTYFSGIRCIFNPEGRGNCTGNPLNIYWRSGGVTSDVHVFVEAGYGHRWTARQMIMYLLFIGWDNFKDYFDVQNPADFEGLNNDVFDKTPWHVAVEGLSLTEAIYAVCKEVGMRFREVYSSSEPRWQFYQPRKIDSNNCAFHSLYCPAPLDMVKNKKVLPANYLDASKTKRTWAFDIETDSTKQVSYAITVGAPDRYEITAELVPSWNDSEFNAMFDVTPPYINEEDLGSFEDPNTLECFAILDSRGERFNQSLGRLWTLNELGIYSFNPYNRDIPRDFYELLGSDARDKTARARFGLHHRPLLPSLTQLGLTNDSSGIRVDFSFDGGASWQPLNCSIINIEDSGGIWIAEPNLHNIKPPGNLVIPEGAMIGRVLSLLSSIYNDVFTDERVFRLNNERLPSGKSNWQTRIRVTACIELEQRKIKIADGGSSPIYRELYDFSDRYRYHKRSASSVLTGTADEHDDSSQLQYQADTILEQNGHIRAAGTFTLDCIDFQFAPGDVIGGVEGRNIVLGTKAAADNNGDIFATGAEIVQVIHEPLAQTTRLITADDRFTE